MRGSNTPTSAPAAGPPDGPVHDEDDLGFSVEHRLRRAASATRPETAPPEPWYRKRVVRDLLILVLVVSLSFAIAPFADVANADYPEARDIADRIHAAWRSIDSGGADPEEAAAAAGLRVHTFEVDGQPSMILTHSEPTSAGSCYALRFGPKILSEVGILAEPTSGCAPQAPGIFERGGSWSEVLPSERITPPWFVPLVVLLFTAGVFAVTDIPIALLTKPRSPVVV